MKSNNKSADPEFTTFGMDGLSSLSTSKFFIILYTLKYCHVLVVQRLNMIYTYINI